MCAQYHHDPLCARHSFQNPTRHEIDSARMATMNTPVTIFCVMVVSAPSAYPRSVFIWIKFVAACHHDDPRRQPVNNLNRSGVRVEHGL